MGEKMSTGQPTYGATAFHCPLCKAYAAQEWITVFSETLMGDGRRGYGVINPITLSACARCGRRAIWHDGKMIYPDVTMIPPPNPDLETEIQDDYQEAASIVNKSPRAAAAILRLCVQKLCKQLGQPGDEINDDIAALRKAGSPRPDTTGA